MITEQQAQAFAEDWIAGWNDHDLERILSHYHDDVEYYSIFLALLADNSSGTLSGKDKLEAYFAKGLAAYPNLRFEFEQVYAGVDSIVLRYRSVNALAAAETFTLNEQGLAIRVQCHYAGLNF